MQLACVTCLLEVAEGMKYVQSRSVIHGDLNPSNVLLQHPRKRSVSVSSLGGAARHAAQQQRRLRRNSSSGRRRALDGRSHAPVPWFTDATLDQTGAQGSRSAVHPVGSWCCTRVPTL
jgi:serine/threonine protein kinase